MSATKHTQGPWGIRHYRSPEGSCYEIEIGLRERPKLSPVCVIRRPDDADEANARLIAAAPELHGALAQIVDILTQAVQFTGIRNSASCDVLRADAAAAVKAAVTALAKT